MPGFRLLHTPIGVFYRCRVTDTWQPVAVVRGRFYPVAIPAF